MKKSKRKYIVLLFLIVIALSSAYNAQIPVKTEKNFEKAIVSPTAKESLKALFANGNISLASIGSCKSQKTGESDKTVFDFLSAIIANQAEPKTKTSLEHGAKLITGKNKTRLWQVELTFNNLDEESGDSWNVGFRFLMRTQNRRMIRGSLECVGN